MNWLALCAGALIGAPSRFALDGCISRRTGRDRPWGTLVVNVSGAALLGVLSGLLARNAISVTFYWFSGIGFCGAYTTFSTFIWETLALAEVRRVRMACVNVALSLVFGITAAYVAYLLVGP